MIAHKPAPVQQQQQVVHMRASQPPAGGPLMHSNQLVEHQQQPTSAGYYEPPVYAQQQQQQPEQYQQQLPLAEQRYAGASRQPDARQLYNQPQLYEAPQTHQVPLPYHQANHYEPAYAEQHSEQIPMHHQQLHHQPHHHQPHQQQPHQQQPQQHPNHLARAHQPHQLAAGEHAPQAISQALPPQQMARPPAQQQVGHQQHQQLNQQQHQQRLGPAAYQQQSQQAQPVRPSMNQSRPLAAAPVAQHQQYKQQQGQHANSMLAAGSYAPQQYQAFAEQPPEHYPSNSPTLLQQQLNRQAGPAQRAAPPPAQQRPLPVMQQQPQMQQQQQQGQKRRFEQLDMAEPGYQEQRQRIPPASSAAQAYYPRGAPGALPAGAQRAGPPPKRLAHPMEPAPGQLQHHQPMLGNPTPPLTPTAQAGGPPGARILHQTADQWHHQGAAGELAHQQHCKPHLVHHEPLPLPQQQLNPNLNQRQMPKSQAAAAQPANFQPFPAGPEPCPSRLTLPLREANLLGPFKLEHDAHFISKVFHLKQPLFETLTKSLNLMSPQTATVLHELQFRAYLVNPNQSNQKQQQQQQHSCGFNAAGDSLLAPASGGRACNWPELFQVSINQNLLHLDRSKGAHRALDVFQFCQLGDNIIEIQVNDCYCNHEFLLEAVERPTLKAFMNSCYKSRQLQAEVCVNKLRCNFGQAGFIVHQPALQPNNPLNEYISLAESFNGSQETKVKISLKCPVSQRRIRTPARGSNCKHLQCFDLESFLFVNRERTQWSCPMCLAPVPFPSLELDQHQMGILQALPADSGHEEILVDSNGQWQIYSSNYGPQPPAAAAGSHFQQQQQPPPAQVHATAKSTGIYHPQPVAQHQGQFAGSPQQQQPMRPMSGPSRASPAVVGSPAAWDAQQQQQQQQQVLQRPASAQQPGRRSANSSPLSKKLYAGQYQQQVAGNKPPAQHFDVLGDSSSLPAAAGGEELSPLAAMERVIIQQEQQMGMGPPPFEQNALISPTSGAQQQRQMISQQQQQQPPQHQSSPLAQPEACSRQFSPAQPAVASPAGRMVVGSPHQQPSSAGGPAGLPQSPLAREPLAGSGQQYANSTPATPSSSSHMLVHGGPETPATPSNSGGHSIMNHHSPHVAQAAGTTSGVDHQPLSNGSASAGSITSSSTMTPSGQSLGSVGMGGDSRCNTAPLQNTNSLGGLDDLMALPANTSGPQGAYNGQHNDHSIELALDEAEWKQQQLEVSRGKSQHLANFLDRNSSAGAEGQPLSGSKMLAGGSDHHHADQSPEAGHALEQLDQFPSYLDTADNGADLPPDDNILDLFER